MKRCGVLSKKRWMPALAAWILLTAAGTPRAAQAVDTEAEILPEPPVYAAVQQDAGRTEKTDPAAGTPAPEGDPAAEKGEESGGAAKEASDAADSKETETVETEEPEGFYTVRIEEIRPDLPPEGRIYDGTDQIRLAYTETVSRSDGEGTGKEEQVPGYTVICESHLDGCDVGERKVIYAFSLQTPWPEHVKLEVQDCPDLTVSVQKAVLSVRIRDGVRKYMDPADPEHIDFEELPAVTVSGFVRDRDGNEMIPEGLVLPDIEVDGEVLSKDSPIYEWVKDEKTGAMKKTVRRYEGALTLKRTEDGKPTGDATENYEFCCDPKDERFTPGTVRVVRRELRYGEDYTLQCSEGTYLTTQGGQLIVRQGSRLRMEPCSGSGYNTGALSEELYGEGVCSFCLQKRDRAGNVTADSLEEDVVYIADGKAPRAAFSVSGAFDAGGVLYASSAAVQYETGEDDYSGISRIRYRILRGELRKADPAGLTAGAWQEGRTAGSVDLQEEGICRVECEVTDGVGNTASSLSPMIVIDHTAPTLTIRGVSDSGAYNGSVLITAECTDETYLSGSLEAGLTAAFGGLVPAQRYLDRGRKGAVISFEEFQYDPKADAIYTLRVSARDLAGNESVRTVTFSVNRFGSSFGLEKQTAASLRTYYHRTPFPVTFTETNTDRISRAGIFLRKGPSLTELMPGDGTLIVRKTQKKGYWRYTYTIPADVFEAEGRYEALLLTSDAAGNSSDSAAQGYPVRFAIDRSAPQCLLHGISEGERCPVQEVTAVIEVTDNIAVSMVRIYADSIPVRTADREQLERESGMIRLTFGKKDDWQTLQIYAVDMAGNECWTGEVSFLVAGEEADGPSPPRKRRLTARQLALVTRWLRRCFRLPGTVRMERSTASPGQGTLYSAEEHAGSGSSLCRRDPDADTGSREERNGHFRRLFAAACALFLLPLLYRISSGIRRRRPLR